MFSQQNLKQKFFIIYFDFESGNSSVNSEPKKVHTIMPGDTLSGISTDHGIPQRILEVINPDKTLDPDLIKTGDNLDIPIITKHQVVPGDTLTSLAERYGTTVMYLAIINGVDPDSEEVNEIEIGEDLLVPDRSGAQANEAPKTNDAKDNAKNPEGKKSPEKLAESKISIGGSLENIYLPLNQDILSSDETTAGYTINKDTLHYSTDAKYYITYNGGNAQIVNNDGKTKIPAGEKISFQVKVKDKAGNEVLKPVTVEVGEAKLQTDRGGMEYSVSRTNVYNTNWFNNRTWNTRFNNLLSQEEKDAGLTIPDQNVETAESRPGTNRISFANLTIKEGSDIQAVKFYDDSKRLITEKGSSIDKISFNIKLKDKDNNEYDKKVILNFK